MGLALNLIDAYINCLGHKGIIARHLTLKYIKKDNMLKAGFFSQLRMPKKEQAKSKGVGAPESERNQCGLFMKGFRSKKRVACEQSLPEREAKSKIRRTN